MTPASRPGPGNIGLIIRPPNGDVGGWSPPRWQAPCPWLGTSVRGPLLADGPPDGVEHGVEEGMKEWLLAPCRRTPFLLILFLPLFLCGSCGGMPTAAPRPNLLLRLSLLHAGRRS